MNATEPNSPDPASLRLTAEDLAARRGESLLFAGLSFRLEPGEALILKGPNGTGKSTLLRVLAGLMRPETGRIALEDAGGESPGPVGEQSHYFGHRNAMRPELTVCENLRFWQRFFGEPREDEPVIAAARAVGLKHLLHLPFGYLSAGQQRRLAFAKLLLSERPLWLLDEPTAALDAGADRLFAALIDGHLARGGLAVVATHQPLGLSARERDMTMAGFAQQEASPWI